VSKRPRASNNHGVVAAGDPRGAQAAAEVLAEGGNAFDAALTALCVACVAEPVLASLGGGGFLLAETADGRALAYDFFVQTPKRPRPPEALDFRPVKADFGAARQTFHIGLGAVATPGVARGLFAVHRDLGTLPMRRIVAPAVVHAREGLPVEPLQAFILGVVRAIFTATPEARALYGGGCEKGLIGAGELLRLPALGDTLEALAEEGEGLFYDGEIATRIVADCARGGGHLTAADLAGYQVVRRRPLVRDYRGARLSINPPPSLGGVLIAFALDLLGGVELSAFAAGGPEHLTTVARAMALTNRARVARPLHDLADDAVADALLDPALVAAHAALLDHPISPRGTTHVSVIDGAGNAAALSVSNGEGSAYIVPGTGIMLNNMLGEEDINPHGFAGWPADRRMASMMAPTLARTADGRRFALGSGGSNRIRTAVLQVLVDLIDFAMTPAAAVAAPRIHVEGARLDIEPGVAPETMTALAEAFPDHKAWPERSMYFGGVHVAASDRDGAAAGAGDPRRGGVAVVV